MSRIEGVQVVLKCAEDEDILQVDAKIFGLQRADDETRRVSVCEPMISRIPVAARLEGEIPGGIDVYRCTSRPSKYSQSTDASQAFLECHERLFSIPEETLRRYLPNAARLLERHS